jgi:hypothetical protein
MNGINNSVLAPTMEALKEEHEAIRTLRALRSTIDKGVEEDYPIHYAQGAIEEAFNHLGITPIEG